MIINHTFNKVKGNININIPNNINNNNNIKKNVMKNHQINNLKNSKNKKSCFSIYVHKVTNNDKNSKKK